MVIQGGTIINYNERMNADIRILDGKIAEIKAEMIPFAGEEVIEASGCYVIPGGVDVHTHFDMPAGECNTSDDFYTGTRAAAAGGTTSIIDFAEPDIGEPLQQGLDVWRRKAEGKSYCDYSFHMTVSEWNDSMEEQLSEIAEQGITSFKCYTAYQDSIGVSDEELRKVMKALKKLDGVLCVHCEDGSMMEGFQNQLKMAGKDSIENHPLSRPNTVEERAVRKVKDMARETGVKTYIVHISTKEGLKEAERGKRSGSEIYAETCPHYLLLDESKYRLPGFESAKFVMSPPLRKKEDQQALWKGIRDGVIDTVSTDHCSFCYQGQKELGIHDFTKIPNGIPSAEHRLCLMYHFGEMNGISPERIVELTSYRPAKIFGLTPAKGMIQIGSDADIVLLRKTKGYRINAENQIQNVDYTPYEGIEVTWKAEQVFLRGRKIAEEGKIKDQMPSGRFLFRTPQRQGGV